MKEKLSGHVCYIGHVFGTSELLEDTQVREVIKREQITQQYYYKLRDLRLGGSFEVYCYDRTLGVSGIPRYTMCIVDSDDVKVNKKKTCACFITPQGKEKDATFASDVGKMTLARHAGYSRLIITFLGHGHKFADIEAVK